MVPFFLLGLLIAAQGISEQCEESLIWYLAGFFSVLPTSNYEQMAFFSGRRLNDLGSFDECNNVQGAHYLLLRPYGLPNLAIGLCIPKDCTKEDLYELIYSDTKEYGMLSNIKDFQIDQPILQQNAVIDAFKSKQGAHQRKLQKAPGFFITANFPYEEQKEHSSLSTGATMMWVIIVGLVLLVTLSTAMDLRKMGKESQFSDLEAPLSLKADQQPPTDKVMQVLLSFSAYSNFLGLFETRSQEKSDTLEILNSVRVFAMGWVILGHTVMIIVFGPISFIQQFPRYVGQDSFIFTDGAFFAVDTFFWMSALMMTYILLTQLNSGQELRVWKVILHRVIRLMPAYLFAFFFFWFMLPYMGNGPLWSAEDETLGRCDDKWLAYFFFLSNYSHTAGANCFGWAWYIAVDFQLFVVGVVIVFLYSQYNKLIGWYGSISIAIFSCFMNLILIGAYGLYHVGGPDLRDDTDLGTFQVIYTKPYCRATTYFIGVLCGIVLYHSKQYQKSGSTDDKRALKIAGLFSNKYIRHGGFLLGIMMLNYLMFAQLDDFKHFSETLQPYWSVGDFMAFEFFYYPILGIGLSLILMPLLLGYFSPLAGFLGAQFWTPLSKLTYSTYLMHLTFIIAILSSTRQSAYLSNMNVFLAFTSMVIFSLLAGLFLYLLVEAPFINIEKIFRRKSTNS